MDKKVTFCTYDAPFFHGPNTWLKRLVSDLVQLGFTIQVLVFFEYDLAECETYQYLVKSRIKVNSFQFKSTADEKIKWILQTLSNDPPSIFIPNMIVHALYASSWLKSIGVPTIGVIHSDEKFYSGILDEFVNGEKQFSLTAIVTCSKYLYTKVNSLKTSNTICRFIPYGIPLDIVHQTSFSDKKLTLIYLGRLVEKQKRITQVIKAVCMASNKIDGVEAVIYGHGEDSKVIKLIKKHSTANKVKFLGAVANKDVFSVLSSAQVFVLLSDYEGLPQSLLEAMACGLVPVCTDLKSGISELITHNQTGIIVKNKSDSFLKAIQTLKQNPGLCGEISHNAKEKVAEYSSIVCTNLWVDLLNELLFNCKPIGRIEVPGIIHLPKRHPYLKYEDTRSNNFTDRLMGSLRNTKFFRIVRKIAFRS